MNPPPIETLLFCGYGRAGKDEAASTIGRITYLPYAGSFSWAVLPLVAKALGIHPQVAWETRHANREFWYRKCNELRANDPTLLARMVLEQGKVSAGIRDKVEIDAVKAAHLFGRIIWIDRPGTPVDPTVTFGPGDCDEILLNDGDLEKFHVSLFELAVNLRLPLRGTHETRKLFLASSQKAAPFVRVPVKPMKPFAVGNE